MSWQLDSINSRRTQIHDLDDASTDSTIRLQVPDSPTECVQSAWTDHEVDAMIWVRGVSGLTQREFGVEAGRPRARPSLRRRTSDDLPVRRGVARSVDVTVVHG